MEKDIITKIVAQVMKVDVREISGCTTFINDLGADSLDVMRIIMNIEEEFGINLPKECIYDINTVDDAVKLIHSIRSNTKPQN